MGDDKWRKIERIFCGSFFRGENALSASRPQVAWTAPEALWKEEWSEEAKRSFSGQLPLAESDQSDPLRFNSATGINQKSPWNDRSRGFDELAGPTRLELATSGVTGRRSNQLNYDPDV